MNFSSMTYDTYIHISFETCVCVSVKSKLWVDFIFSLHKSYGKKHNSSQRWQHITGPIRHVASQCSNILHSSHIMHMALPVSVMVPDVDCCQAPEDKVFIAANVGILSNYMTQTSGCGGIDCPWVLQSSPGQLFNISLLDFSTYKGVSEIFF